MSTSLDHIPGSLAPRELLQISREPLRFLHEHYARYGRVYKTWMVGPVVHLLGPEANRTILVTERHKFSYALGYGRLAFARIFESSIMQLDGEAHRHLRETLTPAVNKLGLGDSIAKVQAAWDRAADSLVDGRPWDAYEFAQRTTFDVSAHALMGLPLGPQLDVYRPHFEKLIAGAKAYTGIRFPFGRLDQALGARAFLIEALREPILEARRREPEGMIGLLAHHEDENGRSMSVDEIAAHVLLLFWAGYDTTASAGSWVMHELAHHPSWQHRMREEIFAALGDDPYDIERRKKLTTLEHFLKEVERHDPSIIIFPRVLLEDVEVEGLTIPKHTVINYSPYMSHRLPDVFESPNTFDPGRWDPALGDRAAKASNLVGFGGGPRLCLGRTFALMQLRVMITTLLRRFQLDPDPAAHPGVVGLPMHHPVGSKILFRSLAGSKRRDGETVAA